MKAFLLFPDRDFDFSAPLPSNHEDLVQDLELATVLDAMAAGDPLVYDASARVLLAGAPDVATIRYRQAVLADALAHPDVFRAMYAIAVAALEDKRGTWGLSSKYPSSILSAAISQLERSVVRLRQLREVADTAGAGMRSEGLLALFRTLQAQLGDDYFETVEAHLRELRFRSGVVISARLDRDNSGMGFVLRSPMTRRASWRSRLGLEPRSSYSFSLAPRDEAGSRILSDLTDRGINLVANAAAQSADHISSYFTMLRSELAFYVGGVSLAGRLQDKGEPTVFPEPAPSEPVALSAEGLGDVALALSAPNRVTGNDVHGDERPLVVVTGANSGGKSTFLRSLGQAQLMMQSGMFVLATSMRASLSSGLFTHFIRDEDTTMTSGRLDQELVRMSEIADHVRRDGLVLLNESFASTNEREGSEIGRQVAYALLEAGVRVVFVTHMFDLAQSLRTQTDHPALFLRAERDAEGRRSYKLAEADPLPTSFGQDIYDRLGGWLDDDAAMVSAPMAGTG